MSAVMGSKVAVESDRDGVWSIMDLLLRDHDGLLRRIETGEGLHLVARGLVLTIMVTMGVFGATIGAYRGGIQILYAGIKLPLVVLLTLGLVVPAFHATRRAVLGRPSSTRERPRFRVDVALVLTSLALGSVICAATAPFVLLTLSLGFGYHLMTQVVVACALLGGLGTLTSFLRAISARGGRGELVAAMAAVLVFVTVGAEMTWTFRPYLVRPRSPEVPFMRSIEGSLLESVTGSYHSARGVYFRDEAPLPRGDAP